MSTSGFADAIIARVGQRPETLPAVDYRIGETISVKLASRTPAVKAQLGVDVFVDDRRTSIDDLASTLLSLAGEFTLDMITNRGQKVWPGGAAETLCTDHWRCRFLARNGEPVTSLAVAKLQCRLVEGGVDPIKTEGLFTFDGGAGFSRGQGQ